MPSETIALLAAHTEKSTHFSYLRDFRVEQCPLFLQHKCTQHRPFTCFHWHFMNQRRRRPMRRRDGTFNYSADNYCSKYDETTGICPDGDDCPFLHRTAGDTERRYHLRYFKTCMCVHDTDSRGFCVKNGLHCAFAHGAHDHRPPVYDIKEIQAMESADNDANVLNALDRERNLVTEDPKWQDTNYVLSNYKTEPCKRPPRLCRQGYACPQYHNSKDKRRSPRKFKYRSTPCPSVKHSEEWGEPGNCDAGDLCPFCHTRTEQQFHPEIYKSTKCNDVQQSGYCPRGVFCAFAHVESNVLDELLIDDPLNLPLLERDLDSPSGVMSINDGGNINSNSLLCTSAPVNIPGARSLLDCSSTPPLGAVPTVTPNGDASNFFSTPRFSQSNSLDVFQSQQSGAYMGQLAHSMPLSFTASPGDKLTVTQSSYKDLLSSFGALSSSPVPKSSTTSAFSLPTVIDAPTGTFDGGPLEFSTLLRDDLSTVQHLPLATWDDRTTSANQTNNMLQQELDEAHQKIQQLDAQLSEAMQQIDLITKSTTLNQNASKEDDDERVAHRCIHAVRRVSELKQMPINVLKGIQEQLKDDLEEVEKVLYRETAAKCMVCEERNRSVTLNCNHFVLCVKCAINSLECPYCQVPIISYRV